VATEASQLSVARNRRLLAVVAVAALAAAGAVVGATLLQTRGERTTVPGAVGPPQPGYPPIELELGLRSDAEARALVRAQGLLDATHPRPAQAASIFRRYHSLEARLGLAFATWSGPASLPAVQALASAHPNDPAVLLNLGWAYYWAGRNADAVAAWEKTASTYPDSPYGVDAEDPLHPGTPTGLPPIVSGLALPKSPGQVAALRRAAQKGDAQAKLRYGIVLWDLKRPVSAERELAAAAQLFPHDSLVRTAAAVGLFWKDDPTRAFAQLGPLTAVFPHSAVVEFHLGVLLLYIGEQKKASTQFKAAIADGPQTLYANYARTLLASLGQTRSP
jgi:tetratricopeptide (TPR) repeat protein